MSDAYRNSQIETIASQIIGDKTSPDEQDPKKLQKYCDYAKTKFNLDENDAMQLVSEAFFYLKLKSAKDIDPLQEADKFGAGFS